MYCLNKQIYYLICWVCIYLNGKGYTFGFGRGRGAGWGMWRGNFVRIGQSSVAQLDVRPTGDQEVSGSTLAGLATVQLYLEIDHEIFSTVILSRWLKKDSCQCLSKYWLTT